MKEFVLAFRRDFMTKEIQPSAQQMQDGMKPWQDWLGGLAAQNKLVSPGNRLKTDGKVVKPGGIVTNGPYAEIKESLGGYIIVRANDYDEAVEMAKNCPILGAPWHGNVEVRTVIGNDGQ